MNGKTHKVGGLCVGIATTALMLNPPYTTGKLLLSSIVITGSLIGASIPDIDHKGSMIGKRYKLVSITISEMFGHRGLTHAPLIHALIYIFLLLAGENFTGYSQLLYIAFVTGIFAGGLSHLFLDFMTVQGIPLLYPFTTKKFRIMKIKTKKVSKRKGRSKAERIVEMIMILITIFIVNYSLFSNFLS